ncbi:MAG TPA: GH116 family glycosyl hydrolase, partial [Armatimonadota bacterium]|nr:GH116 family glycosyl hydrolase [Armatimonadota bacterium]
MAVINQQIRHNSGIPLGGIGTGSVEIRPDGLFHEWQIFNNSPWNPGSPCCNGKRPMEPDDLLFIIRVRTEDGRTMLRYLALDERIHDLYSLSWIRSVSSIRFQGEFPIARLTYEDSDLPVDVTALVFSPFIPLDSRNSGTPGFYIDFTVTNKSSLPVEVSILGMIRNASGYNQKGQRPHNRFSGIGEARLITLGADGLAPEQCSTGDMTFAAIGGKISYITGAFLKERKPFTFRKNKFGIRTHSFLHQFKETGTLPNLDAQTQPELPSDFDAAKLTADQRNQIKSDILQHSFIYDKYQQVIKVDAKIADSPEFLEDIASNLTELTNEQAEWGLAALCSKLDIDPYAESGSLFTVTWFFPNHITPTDNNIGHAYENWFGNSFDVATYLLDNYAYLKAKTLALPEAIYSSSLPDSAADAVTSQLSTLTKCTWWTKTGLFGVWEGLGCCGFHTTDITYQGSFPIISLFPDLQKIQMMHGAAFQREDGRVHHFFSPDFSKVDDGFDRVDMNQQFVMLAARDFQWTGDRQYLETLWPHIVLAMDNTEQLDTDGDGLPDTDTRRNTYDCWDFTGCPSYIASLWLGALKAASKLAKEIGDSTRAAKWDSIYEKGLVSFESKLWNGDYYILWRNNGEIDECCMSDQMSGDWFASACGWESILPHNRIRKALESIIKWNFRKGEGLINASYPSGKKPLIAASDNFQAEAPWTGIEYTVADLLIYYGMVAEGLAIVEDIHDRYLRAGRYWNHVECGGHYYRAMSS